jgi:hypothetical protein
MIDVPRCALSHVPATVDGDLAAVLEHRADAFAAALDPRLHGRDRNTEHCGGVLLRKSLKLSQRDGFAVRRGQSGHEKRDALGKLGLEVLLVIGCIRRGAFHAGCVRSGRVTGALAFVVGDGVRRDPVDPSAEALAVFERLKPAVHANESLLNHVVLVFS